MSRSFTTRTEIECFANENMPRLMFLLRVTRTVTLRVVGSRDLNMGKNVRGVFDDRTSTVKLNADLLSNEDDLLEVLCHEMVHCEQNDCGDLGYAWNGITWRGELFAVPALLYARNQNIEALALPWEREAYGRQKELAAQVRKLAKMNT